MKTYFLAFLLAAGAMLLTVDSASADRDSYTWDSISRSSTVSAPESRSGASTRQRAVTSRSNATSGRSATRKTASRSRAERIITTTVVDDVRPQRRAAIRPAPQRSAVASGETLSGIASYYWQPQPVASGGRFNPDALTAAHKTLPFGTRVRVTHVGNGRSVEVVINDRGPYIAGRIIDLSRRAAQVIGMTGQGIARVNVSILGR